MPEVLNLEQLCYWRGTQSRFLCPETCLREAALPVALSRGHATVCVSQSRKPYHALLPIAPAGLLRDCILGGAGWQLWEVLPTVITEAAQAFTSGKPGFGSSAGIFLFTSVKLSKLSPARGHTTKASSSGPYTQEAGLKHPAHMDQ